MLDQRQEFVIGGYTDPKGSRTGIGSLLLGYYDKDGTLRYAGHVGSGFDRRTLTSLHDDAGRPRAAGPALRARPRPAPIRRALGRAPARRPGRLQRVDRRTASCATPGSRACAGTRTPPKSCGKCHEVTVVMRVLDLMRER